MSQAAKKALAPTPTPLAGDNEFLPEQYSDAEITRYSWLMNFWLALMLLMLVVAFTYFLIGYMVTVV